MQDLCTAISLQLYCHWVYIRAMDTNVRIDRQTLELLRTLAQKQGRTLKGLIKHLAEEASK